jgi:hypothetical protein
MVTEGEYSSFVPSPGWWMFREQSFDCDQLILIGDDGNVAYDDEWDEKAGKPPSDVMSENYWEGNDPLDMTFGPLTRGEWRPAARHEIPGAKGGGQ